MSDYITKKEKTNWITKKEKPTEWITKKKKFDLSDLDSLKDKDTEESSGTQWIKKKEKNDTMNWIKKKNYRSGGRVCKIAKRGKGKAYGKNS